MAKPNPPVVIVPSYGRAGKTTTQRVFRSGVVVVPESQAEAYRDGEEWPEGWEVVSIPDEKDGRKSRKQNSCIELFPGRDIVMVDDDYKYVGQWQRGVDVKCDFDQLDAMLANGFQMARDVGTPLWGINVQVDRRFYREHAPFAFLSVVLGPFMALVGELLPDDLRYDESLWYKEDYDLSLKVLHRFHHTVRLSRYHYMVDHLNAEGGVVGMRNMEAEIAENERLERRWGSRVWKSQLHRSINPIIKVPIKGI